MSDGSDKEAAGSRLQKVVEAIAITPEAAHEFVDGYRRSFKDKTGSSPQSLADKARIAKRIIRRYAAYAGTSGALTALPGTIPGIGTALAIVGGGTADVAITLKIQIDMCMCLVDLYGEQLSAEDKKHLAFVLALGSSVEQLASTAGKKAAEEAAKRMVYQYLKGPALVTVKSLFKKIGIIFTQKAAGKAIPGGVGVLISGGANYGLTSFVGSVAISMLAKDS